MTLRKTPSGWSHEAANRQGMNHELVFSMAERPVTLPRHVGVDVDRWRV
jgi:hypothetical protein